MDGNKEGNREGKQPCEEDMDPRVPPLGPSLGVRCLALHRRLLRAVRVSWIAPPPADPWILLLGRD